MCTNHENGQKIWKKKRVCFSFNHKMNRKGSTHYNTLAAISDTHTITDPITIQNNDRKPFQIENSMRESFCIIVHRTGNIDVFVYINQYLKSVFLKA